MQAAVGQNQYLEAFQDKNGKYGFKNEKGMVVVAAKYDYARSSTTEGLALVNSGGEKLGLGYEGGSWSYVDLSGKEVIRLGNEFYKASNFQNGKALLVKDKKTKIYCHINTSGKVITEKGTQTYSEGVYSGDLTADLIPGGNTQKYGLRHGKGTMTWNSGDKYEGEWKFGKRHGRGIYTYSNGKVVEGEFADNVLKSATGNHVAHSNNQQGNQQAGNKYLILPNAVTAAYQNGRYEGQAVNGVPNGKGQFIYASGAKYEGNWYNGAFDNGKITFSDGTVYEGLWKNGLPDGAGKLIPPNGIAQTGTFANGKLVRQYQMRSYPIGDLQKNNTILYEGRLFYIRGRAVNASGVNEVILSWHNIPVHPDVKVQLVREDNSHFRVYGGFEEVRTGGKPVESKSTYGYYDNKKSANVVVNRTTTTYTPVVTKKLAREGYDVSGHKWVEVLSASQVPPQSFTEYITITQLAEINQGMGNQSAIALAENPGTNALLFTSAYKGKEQLWEYTGSIRHGKANGYGEASSREGMRYKGYWKENVFDSTGKCSWPDGEVYEGAFKDGLFHGKGRHSVGGNTYEGDWVNGQRHGQGKFFYHDKMEYDGDWDNGQRKGKGYGVVQTKVAKEKSFVWGNGHYFGDWDNGRMNGYGKLIRQEKISNKQGDKEFILEEGYFENGVFRNGASKNLTSQEFDLLLSKMKKQ